MAPPMGLTRAGSSPTVSITASACAAKASFSSIQPMSSSFETTGLQSRRDGLDGPDAHDLGGDASAPRS
jgi:hypothetical protein